MKTFFISLFFIFSFANIHSQVMNDESLSSIYKDKDATCSMFVRIKPYRLTDTIEAKIYFKNTGEVPLFIQIPQANSIIAFTR